MADYATKYQAAIDLTADIRRARKRVETISNRMDSFSLESRAPGFVRVVSPARPAEKPIAGGRKKLLLVVCLAAGMLGLAVPIALDRLNPHIVVPGDIEPVLGIAPMGWVAERRDARTAAIALDQVQRIALGLMRERQEHGTGRVAFTAVRSGAGTTTLTLEVARELTRLGVPAVAVEANCLHADARFAGGSPAPNLGDVVAGRARLDEAIVRGNAGTPDRIQLGAHADLPLDVSQAPFRDAIAELGSRYAMVLIDAPPLLVTSNAEVLAQMANAAVLVVPANAVRRPTLQAAARALERLSLAVVGTVLNRVRVDEHARALAPLLPKEGLEAAEPVGARVQRWLWA